MSAPSGLLQYATEVLDEGGTTCAGATKRVTQHMRCREPARLCRLPQRGPAGSPPTPGPTRRTVGNMRPFGLGRAARTGQAHHCERLNFSPTRIVHPVSRTLRDDREGAKPRHNAHAGNAFEPERGSNSQAPRSGTHRTRCAPRVRADVVHPESAFIAGCPHRDNHGVGKHSIGREHDSSHVRVRPRERSRPRVLAGCAVPIRASGCITVRGFTFL